MAAVEGIAKISVIIPALNEASVLGATLRRVQSLSEPKEVVVADGGSDDATPRLARRAGATVVCSPRGRGVQMNRGAERASGDVFFFLHADTLPPAGALTTIRRALAAPGTDSGIFRLRFTRETPLLRLYALTTRLPWIRLAFGDRGLFVERSAFEAVGGYPEWPLFEDLELADRLHRRGGFRFLNEAVLTSPRRFEEHGTLAQQLRNAYLWLHYCLGTDPEKVAHLYEYR
jgi:rSAM/selenodomain-associated transferase 2